MKKIITAIIIIAALVLLFFNIVPKTYFSNYENINNISVYKVINGDTGNDLADSIDTDLLAKSLPLLQSKRIPYHAGAYDLDSTKYEIWCMYGQTPWYIVLGDESFIYTNTSWCYQVLNPGSWIALLDSLTAES